jgi:hypothetical protein
MSMSDDNVKWTKPVLAANLSGGRLRVYYDGPVDAAFWRNLRLLCEQMGKTSLHVQTMAGVEFGFDNPATLGTVGVTATLLMVKEKTGTVPNDAEVTAAVAKQIESEREGEIAKAEKQSP